MKKIKEWIRALNDKNLPAEEKMLIRARLGLFGILVLVLVFLVTMTALYLSNKKQLDKLDPEEELTRIAEEKTEVEEEENYIQNRIEELEGSRPEEEQTVGIFSNDKDKNKRQDFYKEKDKSENKHTYIYNKKQEKIDKTELDKIKDKAYLYMANYNWDMVNDLAEEMSKTYDFRENEEALEVLDNLTYLSRFDMATVEEDKMLLSYVSDPIMYAYGFFFKSVPFQARLLKDHSSVLLYTEDKAPELLSAEEVSSSEYRLNKYYASPSKVKAYKLTFKIEEGQVDFLLAKNYNGQIEPISISLGKDTKFDYVSYEDYIKDKSIDIYDDYSGIIE